jgi:hypothetical protein
VVGGRVENAGSRIRSGLTRSQGGCAVAEGATDPPPGAPSHPARWRDPGRSARSPSALRASAVRCGRSRTPHHVPVAGPTSRQACRTAASPPPAADRGQRPEGGFHSAVSGSPMQRDPRQILRQRAPESERDIPQRALSRLEASGGGLDSRRLARAGDSVGVRDCTRAEFSDQGPRLARRVLEGRLGTKRVGGIGGTSDSAARIGRTTA